ncbi:homocysteine S-methyltransferase [Actinoplanes sp. NEAU-A12]|uniref:Homocysteine S-methyltransferase n=1 Tax=Actinoplanes sandaracinus TaxID=3045177 RepID=A0ABT6WQJ7_9ACTN|nr:homocysteine S-methyltransferase [Actinoplanes sandaracinus]MDI6102009.1 homocysteine S-methyltransferase [Actinoplanes sandaracinus]
MSSLSAAMSAGPVVLDGGLATELAATGHDLSDHLWSARLLHDRPDAIVDAHLAFLRAGAQVVITASYQATFEGLAQAGFDDEAATTLMSRSVTLARQARQRAADAGVGGPRWIAASIGPYGAMLADGSEYRGNYGLTVAELVRFHRRRMRVLADAGADVLALETVPDVAEAEAMIQVVQELGMPAWLSYTIDGDRTRAGQSLGEAFRLAAGVNEVIAVGVNCSAPGDVAPAVAVAAEAGGKPVVVYPNSGETWDAAARTWTGEPGWGRQPTDSWIGAGARLVGGCCRVTPAQIADLATQLRAT